MILTQLPPEQFAHTFDRSAHLFNTVAFALHNARKCRAIHFLAFSDTRIRAGIILGQTDTALASPFSAPFGGPILLRQARIDAIDSIFSLTLDFCSRLSLPLHITLPPVWHNPALISQCVNSLSRIPRANATFNLSHHFSIGQSKPGYQARRDTLAAINSPLNAITGACNASDVTRAYNIISRNHIQRGFPMNMTLPDLISTCSLVGAQTFFVTHHNNFDLAAAIVYTTLPGVAQIILWGNDINHAHMHPMHLLFHHIRNHYTSRGYHTIDIGPSTLNATPNIGLCSFKESLGCTPTLKPTFTIPI